MKTPFFVLLTILILFMATIQVSADKPVIYTMNYSYGCQDKDIIYFLLEYKVWQQRNPVWFILPIERSPIVYFHKLYFYRLDTSTNQLEKLAIVQEEIPPQINIKQSQFTKTNNKIVFTYQAGWEKERGLLYNLHTWNIIEHRFIETETEIGSSDSSPLYTKYFSNYLSPWSKNPGIITITRLSSILEDIGKEKWGLPRDW